MVESCPSLIPSQGSRVNARTRGRSGSEDSMSSLHPTRVSVRAGLKCRGRCRRPLAESLEERIALAVYSVGNTADVGPGSLRQAILNANNSAHADDTIVFDPAVFSTP